VVRKLLLQLHGAVRTVGASPVITGALARLDGEAGLRATDARPRPHANRGGKTAQGSEADALGSKIERVHGQGPGRGPRRRLPPRWAAPSFRLSCRREGLARAGHQPARPLGRPRCRCFPTPHPRSLRMCHCARWQPGEGGAVCSLLGCGLRRIGLWCWSIGWKHRLATRAPPRQRRSRRPAIPLASRARLPLCVLGRDGAQSVCGGGCRRRRFAARAVRRD
jgi:hypothetical protein